MNAGDRVNRSFSLGGTLQVASASASSSAGGRSSVGAVSQVRRHSASGARNLGIHGVSPTPFDEDLQKAVAGAWLEGHGDHLNKVIPRRISYEQRLGAALTPDSATRLDTFRSSSKQGTGFERVISAQLEEVRHKLIGEYNSAVLTLEKKVLALEKENKSTRRDLADFLVKGSRESSKSSMGPGPIRKQAHAEGEEDAKGEAAEATIMRVNSGPAVIVACSSPGSDVKAKSYPAGASSSGPADFMPGHPDLAPALLPRPDSPVRSCTSSFSSSHGKSKEPPTEADRELQLEPVMPANSPALAHDDLIASVQPEAKPAVAGEGDDAEDSTSTDTTVESEKEEFMVLDVWENARSQIMVLQNMERRSHGADKQKSKSILSGHSSGDRGLVRKDTANLTFNDDKDEDEPLSRFDYKLRDYIIAPNSPKRLLWELAGMLCLLHDIIVIPLQILDPPETDFGRAAWWFVRIFWTFDIVLSALTGYISKTVNGVLELRPTRVVRRYMRTRFPLDILIVACDWLEAIMALTSTSSVTDLRMSAMFRILRPLRLVRLLKGTNVVDFVIEHMRSEVAFIIFYVSAVVCLLLILIHITGCCWHGLHYGGNAALLSSRGAAEDTVEERYLIAFHYILALFVGEHILMPKDFSERLFTVVVLIVALIFSASFVGSLTTAMTRLQIIASQRSSQFASLNRYLSDSKISPTLSGRVQRNARHAFRERRNNQPEHSVALLALITDPLRAEIHYEVHSPILTRHPFFYLFNKKHPACVRHICHKAIIEVSISYGDALFSAFEVPVVPMMFFVMSGKLVYTQGIDAQRVLPTRWISEASLWTRWSHRGSLVARSECRLMAIDALRLLDSVMSFPTMHANVYADKYLEWLNKMSESKLLSDIGEGDTARTRSLAYQTFEDVDGHAEVPETWVKGQRRASVNSAISGASMLSSQDSCMSDPTDTSIMGRIVRAHSRTRLYLHNAIRRCMQS